MYMSETNLTSISIKTTLYVVTLLAIPLLTSTPMHAMRGSQVPKLANRTALSLTPALATNNSFERKLARSIHTQTLALTALRIKDTHAKNARLLSGDSAVDRHLNTQYFQRLSDEENKKRKELKMREDTLILEIAKIQEQLNNKKIESFEKQIAPDQKMIIAMLMDHSKKINDIDKKIDEVKYLTIGYGAACIGIVSFFGFSQSSK